MATWADVRQVAERPYWREAEARVVVEAWRGSGEMLARFARRHGVEPRRLARWVGRLERGADEGVRFHPVRLLEPQAEPQRSGSGGPIEIELAHGGRRVCVPCGFEAEDLRRVLVVLGEVAAC